MIYVNTKQATEFITMNIRAGLVTMLHGDPGVGKSAIVHQVAKIFKLKMIDIRLSQVDPTELNGFGCIQGGVAKYIPMEMFPLENTPIPDGYNGFMVFLDEFSAAPKSVEAAAYKLTLDRMVGLHKLHPKTAIVCAGNLITSGAIVNRQSTATQSRMVHLTMTADPIGWVEWASKNKLDYRIISYISNLPSNLHVFDPKHSDKTFACPRTWEFASKILGVIGNKPMMEILPNLAGTLGEGTARQFIAYAETLVDLASIDEIKANPHTAKLSDKPSLRHAASYLVAAHLDEKNIDSVMVYIKRMPMEFQTITLQNSLHRNRSLIDLEPIQDWVIENGEKLL
jgi:energy-coupling factor transporter ATP-binding protein EcfA2